MPKYDYNVIVVGGGTAGLISAYTANLLGGKVALIESHKMGGDCLNTGCVPSKTLIASSHLDSGTTNSSSFAESQRYEKIHARIHNTIAAIEPSDSAERYRSLGIDVIKDTAAWVDGHTIKLSNRTITARRLIISSGSRPRLPSIPGVDLPHVYSSDTIWNLKTLPKQIVVVGGGPIGAELAMAYAQLGSHVSILETGDRVLKMLTEDQSKIIEKAMSNANITIIKNSTINEITTESIRINDTETIPADTVLLATGRQANTNWLEDSPLAMNKKKEIIVDSSLRTNISSVYACGDVTGGYQFTHVAGYEAGFAGSNAIFDWTTFHRKPSYAAIPWSIFTSPEIAHVGVSEKDVDDSHTITHVPLSELDRAQTDNSLDGGIWLISNDKKQIVGATIIGPTAASLINEATLAINKKLEIKDLFAVIRPYPSYGDLYAKATSIRMQESLTDGRKNLLKSIAKRFR